MKKSPVAVIGAGWAGCAAAVELARRGARVTLFEAARTAGGRARRVEHQGRTLDHGQHLLLGAYRDTLHMMRQVGIDPARAMLRLPLQMRYPPGTGGMDFVAPRLPAPFHLLLAVLRARGLSAADKLSLTRFATAARWMDWHLDIDCSVTTLLDRFDQTERLVQLMWRPLCIAALNTPPERASARVFLRVLGDSLGATRSASDMLLPTEDLSALFPDAAITYLEKHHGHYQPGARVRSLQTVNHHWALEIDGVNPPAAGFEQIIIACPASVAQSLLAPHDSARAASLQFAHEPITTCYLQYDASLRLARPWYALADQPDQRQWGQCVFDRGWLNASHAGLLAVVISASSEVIPLSHSTLSESIASQLAAAFSDPALASPRWVQIITEKRATFACTPDLKRPTNQTSLPTVWLAGDYTEGPYPATIEGAVRSGLKAAQHVLAHLR
ncbi:MAG: hydroxysqualene dehydroxylase HpnE [Oxalobacteraceae bacterium]